MTSAPEPCPPAVGCPTDAELLRYLDAAGPGEGVSAHLDGCASCLDRVEALTTDRLLARLLPPEAGGSSPEALPTPVPADTGGGADPRPPADRPAALGGYRVVGELGRGGMGVVYEAIDPRLGRRVAVKVLPPAAAASPEAAARFLREARAAAAVEHPNIVPVYHVGEDAGVPFIVMPRLAGETLDARLRRTGVLPPAELLAVGRQLAAGLAAAHAAGLVHRDVKPSNVWLEPGTGAVAGAARLLDFGLARRAADPALTRADGLVGTPAYMSPEQAGGRTADARADLWGLGVVLYQMTAGRRPFAGADAYDVLAAVEAEAPPPLAAAAPHAPPGLAALVGRLLAKAPADRPGSAAEVEAELRRIEAAAAARGARGRRPRLAAAAVAAGLAAAGWLALGPARPPAAADPPAPPAGPADPVRIGFIALDHVARLGPGGAAERGVIGRDSFDARLGDQVTVRVELSRPAYCYLVALRPDGVAELIFPEDPTEAPPLTDRPGYPSKSRGDVYGLGEGTGLWVFAAVASPTPLPPYRQAAAGTVWWDDSRWVEGLTRQGAGQGTRGAGEAVPGKGEVVQAAGWLKSLAGPAAEAAAIGFVVRPAD